ncbi:hypothetical protein Kpol_297p6 [Vanderwaltozyma polyspora DSM 70294]|uniref:COX assembly mitochondrial protein n=1 Tax=Vanderwaltozyma polyspora (strain ATCC 22028 / DSM 70294 / BCRC 21397 / CBS 2163 / NBRC 10782 / NRRL Y-8283 / UCD 57-17) TaxID=436907 RepID=A7TSL0_VANPO|nr:uncharacterized protein Kpol_297p6 [Vanderwaltozyma polyspora DSM 70294]EDO14745.1 hypothetical protein Kpol_297p6 [Vanderwaltozyma polyspora DSM 70294]
MAEVHSEDKKEGKRLPLWVLAPKDEMDARKNLKKFAYEQCKEYVEAMAACAKANGMKVFPACNEQRDRMAECILFYQIDTKYLDMEKDKIIEKKIALMKEKKD